jgi:hypothetical protein
MAEDHLFQNLPDREGETFVIGFYREGLATVFVGDSGITSNLQRAALIHIHERDGGPRLHTRTQRNPHEGWIQIGYISVDQMLTEWEEAYKRVVGSSCKATVTRVSITSWSSREGYSPVILERRTFIGLPKGGK